MFKWVTLLLAVSCLVVAVVYARWQTTPLAIPAAGIVLNVSPGDSLSSISRDLAARGILKSPRIFGLHARLGAKDRNIRSGEYSIVVGTTPVELLEILAVGKVVHYALTIPEGFTVSQFVAKLQADDRLTQSADLNLETLVPGYLNPEGWLFPDTYHVPRGMDTRSVLQTAYQRMKLILDEEWEARETGLPYETAYQALIMASIIEKETGMPSERAEIAAVFVSRMRLGMRLQTDPTIIYGLGDGFDGNLTRKHLHDGSNPYNTYRIDGMPPTPIALPGRAAIHAALHPANSTALYFVARGDGSHHFSKTLQEHEAAVRRYQLH